MELANLIYYALIYTQAILQIVLYIAVIYLLLGPFKTALIHLTQFLSIHKTSHDAHTTPLDDASGDHSSHS